MNTRKSLNPLGFALCAALTIATVAGMTSSESASDPSRLADRIRLIQRTMNVVAVDTGGVGPTSKPSVVGALAGFAVVGATPDTFQAVDLSFVDWQGSTEGRDSSGVYTLGYVDFWTQGGTATTGDSLYYQNDWSPDNVRWVSGGVFAAAEGAIFSSGALRFPIVINPRLANSGHLARYWRLRVRGDQGGVVFSKGAATLTLFKVR